MNAIRMSDPWNFESYVFHLDGTDFDADAIWLDSNGEQILYLPWRNSLHPLPSEIQNLHLQYYLDSDGFGGYEAVSGMFKLNLDNKLSTDCLCEERLLDRCFTT